MKNLLVGLLMFVSGQPVMAQSTAVATQGAGSTDTRSIYDKIWQEFTTIYDDSSNPVVQRVLFSGRFQHDFAAIGADQGDHDEWNTRRLRLGPRVTLFRTFTLSVEAELNPQEMDPLYMRLTDAYLQWSRSGRFVVTAGKQSVPYTMDGATSSKELVAVDRSNLTNNIWFPQEYLPGVSVSGRTAPWTYRLGVYSAGTANKEFGEFDGGTATLAVVGYDFAKALGTREALLAANYVHQSENPNNTFTRQLQNILSVNFKLDTERWGVRSDVSTATGYLRQSDLWGVMAMPYFNVTDKLQLVGRYTFLESDDPNGVQLATYENRVVAGRGDEYNEMYVGANYYFYGHRLKLQTGIQVADMSDRADDAGAYSGVSWTSGIRVGW
jgi:phosphate-selective porin OprO and OprP